jgi:chromatin remodeling complex protein RSC6
MNQLQKPLKLSPEMSEFVGGATEMPRTEVTKKIWEYIKTGSLQNPANKREIICDEKLAKLLKKEKLGMMEIAKALSPHFIK